ncbi:uncharacterized protein LOC110976815 [Acanthaster planci]|uniref:Uncharacterized protein LOC110976815 n=1 Tax=Acanthaster planci TaxID=133434 RepID=A0A8B7Y1D8_ACAPL|nr:uncharacterized protein LOC110976815 [Acanthaster planci]XP_022086116.1 uncharacterized protein LOC110976815 [Acanthaster planci]
MASRSLVILLAVAMVFSLATAFYDPQLEDDLDFEALEREVEKRDDEMSEDLLQMDKRSYPRCRHWLTKQLCRCDNSYGRYEEERYHCMYGQRGSQRGPFRV